MRLGKYLKEKYPDFSSKEIKRSLENGACTVNGKIETFASREVNPGKDKIKFKVHKFKAQEKLSIKKNRIIFEDDDVLVYDKEAGHACMATESKKVNLHEELRKNLGYKFLEPAHRLDKETSGLMVFCKNNKALKHMLKAFKDKEVKKTYIAKVDGQWSKKEFGSIKNFLELDFKKNGLQKWKVSKAKKETAEKNSRKYKASHTDYKVIKALKDSSLVEAYPQTGRTHQIRIHMAYLGHPILGDSVYGENFKHKELYTRHLLHARRLEFTLPNKEAISLESELPSEF